MVVDFKRLIIDFTRFRFIIDFTRLPWNEVFQIGGEGGSTRETVSLISQDSSLSSQEFSWIAQDFPSVTLPQTSIAPENGWLEYYFPFGFRPIFRGELLVSGSVSWL